MQDAQITKSDIKSIAIDNVIYLQEYLKTVTYIYIRWVQKLSLQ